MQRSATASSSASTASGSAPVAGGAGHEPFDQEKIKFIKVHAEDPLLNSIGNCSAPPMIKPLARKRAIFSVINKEVIIHHILYNLLLIFHLYNTYQILL